MKNIKIILALLAIIISVGVATNLGVEESVSLLPDKKEKATIYFVPVGSYFSNLDNLTREDLNKEEILYLAQDKELLKPFINDNDVAVGEETDLVKRVQKGSLALVRWNQVSPNLKTLSFEDKYLWQKDDFRSYGLKVDSELTDEQALANNFDSQKLTKINFLGDIMLSRHVNTQMERLGFGYSWEKVKKQVADADITFANLEVPISDMRKSPAEGMSFIAPTKNLKYLKEAGIDVVSVANNHTANFGEKAFTDNLANLKKSGIGICGGGLTEQEARTPYTVNKNGTNFSFLCQSAITGSLYADGKTAGVPYLGIEPWYRDDKNSIASLVADIKAIAEKDGVVIASPHWGVEYKHTPNSSQRMVAKEIIDAGAELIVGTHPHVVQSLEYYKEKYIAYSLGNFIFDQEWSTETKQGVMVSAYFYGDRNVATDLVPLQIENYAQPRFVSGSIKEKIIGDIQESSKGF